MGIYFRARALFTGGQMKYVIALDAGTTSVRAYLYDVEGGVFVHGAQQEVGQSFPRPGWVEQDAGEIWFKAMYCLNNCVRYAGAENIVGIGVANQRETVVMWDRTTGEPICPAIVWQCRRTSEFCENLPGEMKQEIARRTGLLPDAYFLASKIKWNFDNLEEPTRILRAGNLCIGTVDSYLIFRLTGKFATDYTNASRTMLFNIHSLAWDEELLHFFSVPKAALPEALPSDACFGYADLGGKKVPVAGVAGDQQAALVGQAALGAGEAKATYGTGLFLLFNTGEACVSSAGGLLTTVGYAAGGKVHYALEGSVFNAGSSVQWLRDGVGLITTASESEQLARSVEDTGGVYFVPAFTGLGAPHWRADARALLSGVTRGTTRAHIVRAVLESIAYSAKEIADCMQRESGVTLKELRCDGGACANDFLMQFQADVLGVPASRPRERESTALGAAYLCCLALGLMGEKDLATKREAEKRFLPSEDRARFQSLYAGYEQAVARALYPKS